LENIIAAISELKPFTMVFPVHPRTLKNLKTSGLHAQLQRQRHVRLIKPLGYLETLKLIKNARILLTDSGGMQKEAFWLKTPCITLRENTEWTETVDLKANYLTGSSTSKIVQTVKELMKSGDMLHQIYRNAPNPYGDGKASEKIIAAVKFFKKSKANN
jgi:UDP-N-acetylglucosamine 2-epimerase (non-hydrolysing)